MTGTMPQLRLYIVAWAYTLWLAGIFGVFYLAHGKDVNSLQVAVLAGAIPAGLQLFLLGVESRGLIAPVRMWLVYLLVILLSYVVNTMDPLTAASGDDGGPIPAGWMPLVYTVNAAFIMAIGTLVGGCRDRRLLQTIAAFYCIVGAIFLVYVDITGERLWGRLRANDIEPNVWGLVGLTVCLAALARKRGLVALAAFAAGMSMILIAQSREHLVAVVIVLMVCVALELPALKGGRLFVALMGLAAATVLAAVLLDPYILDAIGYIETDVLMIYSKDRGIDSGFTGRTEIWGETYKLWQQHPLFGIGYRQHERFLSGAPAHNAYLAVLADTGIFGFLAYITLLIASLLAAWGIREPRTRRFVAVVVVGYAVIGFFDRRTIDAGNPCSLFFLMCCSLALADGSLRRAAARYSQALLRRQEASSAHPSLSIR